MTIQSIQLKAFPYRTEYTVIKEVEGYYSLEVAEYCNDQLTMKKKLPYLTKDEKNMTEILNLFSKNNVFAIHAEEILEDMGYPIAL